MIRRTLLIGVASILVLGLSSWHALPGEKKATPVVPKEVVKKATAFHTIVGLLDEQLDMKYFQTPLSLKESLALFMEHFATKGKELAILVDSEAFKEENPDAPPIYDTVVQFPPFPKKMKLATALRLALSKAIPANATYVIRQEHIEITTFERVKPEALFGFPILAQFHKLPLHEALEELSSLSGATILLDTRVGDKAHTAVSARFQNTVSLETAVRLLAEMADLETEVRGNVLFVTNKPKAEGPQAKAELHLKGRRLDLALRDLAAWSGAQILLDPKYIVPPTPIFGGTRKQPEADEGPKGKAVATPLRVHAIFKPGVSAEAAARVLANQAGLSVVVLEHLMYVTDRDNAGRLLEEAGKLRKAPLPKR
jgi:hypothetical protein